jgi:hypothetical protein
MMYEALTRPTHLTRLYYLILAYETEYSKRYRSNPTHPIIFNHFTNKHQFGFESAIWYWHSVDVSSRLSYSKQHTLEYKNNVCALVYHFFTAVSVWHYDGIEPMPCPKCKVLAFITTPFGDCN